MDKKKFLQVFENLAIVAFALAYFRFDLQIATRVLMGWMTAGVMLYWLLRVQLPRHQLLTWLVVVILGGATVALKDDSIIKWKGTIINTVLATVLALSHVIGKQTIIERLLEGKFECPPPVLRRVSLALIVFLLVGGSLNLFVAYNFSTDIWVNYKLFGGLLLNLGFISGVFYYLRDYLKAHFQKQDELKRQK